MRRMEFKMERTGLLEVGDVLPVTVEQIAKLMVLYTGQGLRHVCQLRIS